MIFWFYIKQILRKEIVDYIWGCVHKNLLLFGPKSYNTDCELVTEDDGECVKFGSGWHQFCEINGFKAGDALEFECKHVFEHGRIYVNKVM